MFWRVQHHFTFTWKRKKGLMLIRYLHWKFYLITNALHNTLPITVSAYLFMRVLMLTAFLDSWKRSSPVRNNASRTKIEPPGHWLHAYFLGFFFIYFSFCFFFIVNCRWLWHWRYHPRITIALQGHMQVRYFITHQTQSSFSPWTLILSDLAILCRFRLQNLK